MNIQALKQQAGLSLYPVKNIAKKIRCFNAHKHTNEDRAPSLCFYESNGEIRWHCHPCNLDGDILDYLEQAEGIPTAEAIKRLQGISGAGIGGKKTEAGTIKKDKTLTIEQIKELMPEPGYKYIRHHVYEAGEPPYIKPIYKNEEGDKTSRYFTVSGEDRYIWGRKSKPVWFNQHLLTEQPDAPVFATEGERDADSVKELGLIGITAGSATDKITPDMSNLLKGRAVIILCDNDQAGKERGQRDAAALQGIAASIKIIELPGLPVKGDISDFIGQRKAEGKEPETIKGELLAIIENTSAYKSASMQHPLEEWPDPIPFDDFSLLPDFPADTLPRAGALMVRAVAETNQVDPALPGLFYLAALSTACAKKAIINLDTHIEPLNTWTCSISDSGTRKSSTYADMTRPLYEQEALDRESMKDGIREALNSHKIREARLAKLQKQAANCDDKIQRFKLQEDASEITKEIAENQVPVSPLYVADNATTEAVGLYMSENKERLAIISPEAGVFDIMAGLYSDKGINLDIYLKGHAGDACSYHRIGRESITMQNPALTLGLAIQSDVLNDINGTRQLRGRGLLARFLFAVCKSQTGFRQRMTKGIDAGLKAAYAEHIRRLMNIPIPQQPAVLKYSPEALTVWEEFYNDIEKEMRPGGSLEYMPDWGSKLPGAVARISGLLHLAAGGPNALNQDIKADIAVTACILGAYFKEHALAVFGVMTEDPRLKAAKIILKFIESYKDDTFKARDILEARRILKTMEDVIPGLKILQDRGFIQTDAPVSHGTGRPESTIYRINPKIKTQAKLTAEVSRSQDKNSYAVFC